MTGPTNTLPEPYQCGMLKLCPFCGCEMECYLDTYGGLAGGWNLRGTHKEGCIMKQVRIINTSKKEGLIEGWNMRANE